MNVNYCHRFVSRWHCFIVYISSFLVYDKIDLTHYVLWLRFSIILWIHYFSSWSYVFHFLSLTIQTGLVLIINSIVHLTKPEGKTDYYYNEHFNENKFLLSTDLMPHGKIYFDSSYQDIHLICLIKIYSTFGCLRQL